MTTHWFLWVVSVLAALGGGYWLDYSKRAKRARATESELFGELEVRHRRIDQLNAELTQEKGFRDRARRAELSLQETRAANIELSSQVGDERRKNRELEQRLAEVTPVRDEHGHFVSHKVTEK